MLSLCNKLDIPHHNRLTSSNFIIKKNVEGFKYIQCPENFLF